jgi:hypothetical protein
VVFKKDLPPSSPIMTRGKWTETVQYDNYEQLSGNSVRDRAGRASVPNRSDIRVDRPLFFVAIAQT